jgi:hypothetical protein
MKIINYRMKNSDSENLKPEYINMDILVDSVTNKKASNFFS